MLAFERDVCPRCRLPRVLCSNPETVFHAQRSFCYATAAQEQLERMVDQKYKPPEPDHQGTHPTDGMRVFVSTQDYAPDDKFI